jgi:transposase-like protein
METLDLATLAREYSDESAARAKFEEMRWGQDCKNVACPHCGVVGQPNGYRVKVSPGSSTRPGLWRCRSCKGQFTVTKGTVFEDSHVPMTKWLLALCLLASSKKGMSAHQIHRMLKVRYQTAWFMMHRLRYAMASEPMTSKLRGVVEVDETFLGGQAQAWQRTPALGHALGDGRRPGRARRPRARVPDAASPSRTSTRRLTRTSTSRRN